jgi:hypothetical protein
MTDFKDLLPNIPTELIEGLIIPNSALSWLLVSKKYNSVAIKYAVNDPLFLSDPASALCNTILTKNYSLLNALLADKRYTAKYILSQVLKISTSDKTANMAFAKFCFRYDWLQIRLLDLADANGWIDVMDYVLNHKDLKWIPCESLQNVSPALFERSILHPKLKWNNNFIIADIIQNDKLPDSMKLKILEVPEISLPMVIVKAEKEVFVDALLADQRIKDSTDLQIMLWKRIVKSKLCSDINYDKYQKIKTILENNLLNPTIKFNYPLRKALKENNFDENIAQLFLDDDRITLTLEPFKKNLINSVISSKASRTFSDRIKFILSHPKFNKEWLEQVMAYLLDHQAKPRAINNIEKLFLDLSLHRYLSEGIRERFPRAINYDDTPDFYSDEE